MKLVLKSLLLKKNCLVILDIYIFFLNSELINILIIVLYHVLRLYS